MKKILLLFALFSTIGNAAESPCYFGGAFVKCFPSGGIWLDNLKTLRLGTNNATNYVELAAPSGMALNYTVTWPSTVSGFPGYLLADSDGTGTLGWTAPGATQSTIDASIAATQARKIVDLVCHSNVTVSGTQTCDGQSTTGAFYVLLMGQTLPADNGIYQVDDFAAWTRIATQGNVAGSLVNVTSQGGGTLYSDTLWLGYGDGGATSNYYRVPTMASNGTLTASKVMATDSNGYLTTASTTPTQVNYLSAATGTTGTTSTNVVFSGAPTIQTAALPDAVITPGSGGGATADLLTLRVKDSTQNKYLTLAAASSITQSADRTLSLDVKNGSRAIKLAGSIDLAGALTTSGAFDSTFTMTGATGVTFPTTGTLATVSGALGTPTSVTLTNGTGLPLTTGVTGTLPIANGGTASTTAQTAINTLAGAQTDNRVLQGNGTNIVLGQIDDPTFFAAGAYNTGAVAGTLPIVTAMSDSLATQMGLKQYYAGTNYNGGISPTVTNNGGSPATTRAIFVPYMVQDGTWRLKFNISMTFSSATITQRIITINGVLFKNVSGAYQPISGMFVAGTLGSVTQCWADPNTATLVVTYTSTLTATGVAASGDVELDAKPSWAY